MPGGRSKPTACKTPYSKSLEGELTLQSLRANSKTLPELVSEEIKHYIIEQHLCDGDRLPSEHELAKILNVSRASIRESLATLAAIGILEVRVGRGAFVRDFSMKTFTDQIPYGLEFHGDDLQELVDIRKLLEVYAVRKAAASLSADQLARFRTIVAAMNEKAEQGKDFIDEDIRFHEAIAAIAGKNVLRFLLNGFWEIQRKSRQVISDIDTLQKRYMEHLSILQALESGDVDAAVLQMEHHFDRLKSRVTQISEGRDEEHTR